MQIKKNSNTEKSSGTQILLPQSVRKAFNHKLQRPKVTNISQSRKATKPKGYESHSWGMRRQPVRIPISVKHAKINKGNYLNNKGVSPGRLQEEL